MKKVKVSFDWWVAVLEIDPSEKTLADMKEQLLFWGGGEDSIQAHGGDIEAAYLIILARQMIYLSMEFNIHGVKAHFEEAEGWAPIDGSHGVNLISVDCWDFGYSDFSTAEI